LVVSLLTLALQAVPVTAESDSPTVGEQALETVIADRETVVFEIVNRLGPEAEALGLDHWQEELTAALYGASANKLRAARSAEDYTGVVAALAGAGATADPALTQRMGADALAGGIAALDSTEQDLTFTPITPCRIVDTREAGGAIAADSSRAFDARGPDLSDQGGGTCADLLDDAAAIAITVTVAGPASPGFLTVYPEAAQLPLASTINFQAGDVMANSTMVKTAYLQGFDFRIYAFQTTHVVVDLLGVFNPLRVAPTAQAVATSQNHSGSFNFTSPTCPAGTVFSGPGHAWTGGAAGVWLAEVNRDGNNQRTRCRGLVDRGGATSAITCSAHCIGLD
jgi:hypothetical protein